MNRNRRRARATCPYCHTVRPAGWADADTAGGEPVLVLDPHRTRIGVAGPDGRPAPCRGTGAPVHPDRALPTERRRPISYEEMQRLAAQAERDAEDAARAAEETDRPC